MKKRAAKIDKQKKKDDRADKILARTVKNLENSPGQQPNKFLVMGIVMLVLAMACMAPTPFFPMREWYFNSIGPAKTSVGFLYFDVATPFLEMFAQFFDKGFQSLGVQGSEHEVQDGKLVESQTTLVSWLGKVTGEHSLQYGMSKYCASNLGTIAAWAAWGNSCSTYTVAYSLGMLNVVVMGLCQVMLIVTILYTVLLFKWRQARILKWLWITCICAFILHCGSWVAFYIVVNSWPHNMLPLPQGMIDWMAGFFGAPKDLMMISSIFCILTDAFILFALMGYLMIREEAFEENLKFLEERYADTDTAPLIGPPPPDDRRYQDVAEFEQEVTAHQGRMVGQAGMYQQPPAQGDMRQDQDHW